MAKSNLDKNALSYAVLSKIYMVNFIVIAALFCVAGFGVNLKFEDVKGEIYAQNAYFSNFLSERFAAADSELRLIEKYLAANAADVKTVFEFSLNNSPEYVAFFIADKNGEIKFTTDEKLGAKYRGFFASKPWADAEAGETLRSKFALDKSDSASRFTAIKMSSGEILAVLINYSFIYDELTNNRGFGGAKSFVVSDDGEILFHGDTELVLERKKIFDVYGAPADYIGGGIKFALNSPQKDIYLAAKVPNEGVAAVSYYPLNKLVRENLIFLLVCGVFLGAGSLFTLFYAKFMKQNVVKPIYVIKNLTRKARRGEEISGYLKFGEIDDFEQIASDVKSLFDEREASKAALERYSSKFGFLFEKGPFILLLIDAKSGEILEASAKACEFYGLSAEEIKGKNLTLLNAPDLAQIKILQEDGAQIYETSRIAADGQTRQIRIRKQNYELSCGEKIGFCVIEDVTQSDALKKNAVKEDLMSEHSPAFSVAWKGGLVGAVSGVSHSVKRVLGYKPAEMLAADFDFKNIIHPDDLDKFLNEFNIKFRLYGANLRKKEFESLQPCRLMRKNLESVKCDIFVKFISQDGKNIDEAIGYFIECELSRNLISLQGAASSLSSGQGLRGEAILRLLANSSEGVATVLLDGTFAGVNDAFCKVSGYEKSEAVGKPSNLLKSGVHDAKFYENMWQSLLKNGFYSGEVYNKRKNGEIYLEQLSIVTIFESGKPAYFVAAFHELPWREPGATETNQKQRSKSERI